MDELVDSGHNHISILIWLSYHCIELCADRSKKKMSIGSFPNGAIDVQHKYKGISALNVYLIHIILNWFICRSVNFSCRNSSVPKLVCRTSLSRSRTPDAQGWYLHLEIGLGDIDCVPSDRPFDELDGHDGLCNILLSGHGLLWWVSRRTFVIESVTIQNQPSPIPKCP